MNDGLGPEGSYYEAKAREEERQRRCKADAAYPMTITILYLGFVFDLWHPGWLVFLTIPLRYIHFKSAWDRWTHPVTITLIYLALGCFWDLWHPGWMIFLLIPVLNAYRK